MDQKINKLPCTLVVIEGLDCVGKTTIAHALAKLYKSKKKLAVVRAFEKEFHNGSFQYVRQQHDEDGKYFIQLAAISALIKDILQYPTTTIVICDRYINSINAYYESIPANDRICSHIDIDVPCPTLSVLLECSDATRLKRLCLRDKTVSQRKLNAMTIMASKIHAGLFNSQNWFVIDNENISIEECANVIYRKLEDLRKEMRTNEI